MLSYCVFSIYISEDNNDSCFELQFYIIFCKTIVELGKCFKINRGKNNKKYRIAGITFFGYADNQMIGKLNNLKSLGERKSKGLNRLA